MGCLRHSLQIDPSVQWVVLCVNSVVFIDHYGLCTVVIAIFAEVRQAISPHVSLMEATKSGLYSLRTEFGHVEEI